MTELQDESYIACVAVFECVKKFTPVMAVGILEIVKHGIIQENGTVRE